MGSEKEIIKRYRKIGEDFPNRYVEGDIRYFCAEFIAKTSSPHQFSPDKLEKLCNKQQKQGIGYLSDIILTLNEDKVLKEDTKNSMKKISQTFYDQYENWIHIGQKQDLIKKLSEAELEYSPHLYNHKWKVYPIIETEDILDWLDLYFEDYMNGRVNTQELLLNKKKFLRLSL